MQHQRACTALIETRTKPSSAQRSASPPPPKLHRSKPKGHPHINASHASDALKTRELLGALRASLDRGRGKATNTNAKWEQVCSVLYQVGLEVVGRKEKTNTDWFEANRQEMEPAVEAKRKARLGYTNNPCQATPDALREARIKCQQTLCQ